MSSGRSYVSRRVMQHSTAAEAILLRLAQGGDSAAFDELVLRRQGSIRSLLRRLCGDSARADDFAQHAFYKHGSVCLRLRVTPLFQDGFAVSRCEPGLIL